MAIEIRGSLKRKSPTKGPYKLIHLVLEGGVTEPDYLENFFQSIDAPRFRRGKTIRAAGVPKSVVERCIELKAQCDGTQFGKSDQVWAIFDVDDHPNLLVAVDLARRNKIPCVISNPCIEIWGLLHHAPVDRPMSRGEAQDALALIAPKYHHEKNPRLDWAWCNSRLQAAEKNARAGRKARDEEGNKFPHNGPFSNFDRLLSVIRDKPSPKDKTWCEW